MSAVISILSKNQQILKELKKVLPNVTFHHVENVEQDKQLKQSEIILADFDLLGPQLYNLPNAKWVQGAWAGYDKLVPYIRPNQLPPYPITRFTGQHLGRLMSEYVVANIVNQERDFFTVKDNQRKAHWARENKITQHRSIHELTIGILGLGHIGYRVAQTLHYMGAKILGYGRRDTIDLSKYEAITEYYNQKGLPKFLSNSDYVINILPCSNETKGLLNGDVLENCKEKGTVFINIGRGSIISLDCLIRALEQKWLSAAIVDVFEPEPLNPTDPLWNMPNVFITPHVSGMSRAQDVAEQFKENYILFKENKQIPATIDFA